MRMGKTLSQRLMTAVLALAMLLATGATGSQIAMAQTDGNNHTFESGEVLTWDTQWEIDPDATISDSGVESVLLSSDGSLLMVMGMPNGFALDEARDIVLDSFLEVGDDAVTIDRGAYGAVSYSLDRMTLDEAEFGVFTLFRSGEGSSPTFAYVFVSIIGLFTGEFAKAQNGITLDGAGLFDGVNGGGLQDQLQATPTEANDDEDETTQGEDANFDEAWNAPQTAIEIRWTSDWESASEDSLLTLTRAEFQSNLVCQVIADPRASEISVQAELEAIIGDTLASNGGSIQESASGNGRALAIGTNSGGLYSLEAFGIGDADSYVRCLYSTIESDVETAVEFYTDTVLLDGEQPLGLSAQYSTGSTSTPDDDDASTPEDESNDGDSGTGGLKGGSGTTSTDDGSEAADDGTDETDGTDDTTDDTGDDGTETGETGLIDDDTFVSVDGTVIEWGTDLILNPDRDPNLIEDDAGIGFMALLLDGDAAAFIPVTVVSGGAATAADYVAYWTSDDYLAERAFSPDSEILLSESSSALGAVVRVDYTDSGTVVIFYSEVRVDEENGSIVLIEYSTAGPLVESTLPLVQDGLTVNGEAVLDFFSLEEILEAAGL